MTKQAITIISGEETFCNLATFEDIKQLNDTVRTYKELYADSLSKTAVEVLNVLHRHSAKFTGVSFLTKNNIAKLVGKSRRTVIRVCQALEDIGVISQYEMKRRSDMRQTSSAIVIQPIKSDDIVIFEAVVTQDHPEMSHHT